MTFQKAPLKFNFQTISSLFIFLLIIVGLTFVVYTSEITYNGLARAKYLPYFGTGFIALCIQLISLFRYPRAHLQFLLTIYTILISSLLLEVYFVKESKKTSKYSSEYIRVLDEIRGKGEEAALSYMPILFAEQPTARYPIWGMRNIKTVEPCNENGFIPVFQSDRYGFNNEDSAWSAASEFDFIILGDSFAQGQCVRQDQTVASLLRNEYRLKGVSLGKSGNGPLTSWAAMLEFDIVRPDGTVIWFFYEGNDMFDILTETQNTYLVTLNENTPRINLTSKPEIFDEIISSRLKETEERARNTSHRHDEIQILEFLKFTNLRAKIRDLKEIISPNLRNYTAIALDRTLSLLNSANNLAKKRNANFLVVYIPKINRFSQRIDQGSYRDRNLVLDYFNKNNIRYLDLTLLFSQSSDDVLRDYYPSRGGHLSSNGYSFLAGAIVDKLKK